MTVVPDTGDVAGAQVSHLGASGADRANARAEQIRQLAFSMQDGLTEMRQLAMLAWDERDWADLGYGTWAAYVKGEFQGRCAADIRMPVMQMLARAGHGQRAIAAATGVSQKTVSRDLVSESLHDSPGSSVVSKRCSACGEEKPLGEFNKDNSRADGLRVQCRNCQAKSKATPAKPKPAPRSEKRKAEVAELQGIRQDGDEHKYHAMLAAPPGAVNRPLIDRAEKIEDLLGDLCALAPEVAVTMMPANRCREFTIGRARWWLEFAEQCERRRAEKTPQLLPVKRWSRNAAANAVLAAAEKIPAEAERQLSGQARAALDWLREHDGWATQATIGVGIDVASSSLGNNLRAMVAAGWLEVGKDGRAQCYRAAKEVQP